MSKNDEKMNDPESIQNHSRMVQGPQKHQTTSKIINLDSQMLRKKYLKNTPNLIKLMSFGVFFDVLEVPGLSWNDSGSILDRSFFDHFCHFFAQMCQP